MAFDVRWGSSGIGFNGAGLALQAGPRYVVRWGDGFQDIAEDGTDENGDGIVDTVRAFHEYGSDGVYDVAVFVSMSGQPPQRLRAFMFASEADNLNIGGGQLPDMILTGSGADFLRGGAGDDWITSGVGADRLFGQDGNDLLLGGDGGDLLYGGADRDLLGGGAGDDRLFGEGDGDFIFGDEGRDQLFGDGGDDRLAGGAGVDRLTGGAGADTFVFGPLRDPMTGQPNGADDPDRDQVLDFVQGVDFLSIGDWFPNGFEFVGTGRFSGTDPSVRYAFGGGGTVVFGDVDGDQLTDFSFRIEGAVTLTEADFF